MLERDQTYAAASAPLSAGGIRQQFTTPANVQLSCYGAQFLREGLALLSGQDPREVQDRIQFREAGYLTLASEKGASALRENVAIPHAGGADWIDLLDPTHNSAGSSPGCRRRRGPRRVWAEERGLLRSLGLIGRAAAGREGARRPIYEWRGRVPASGRGPRHLGVAQGRVFPELRPRGECVRGPRFRINAVVTHST